MAKKTSTSVILEVNRHEFAAGLRAVLLAVASNPLTHMGERLTCVWLYRRAAGRYELVAADGHWLAKFDGACEDTGSKRVARTFIRSANAQAILKMLRHSESETVTIDVVGNAVDIPDCGRITWPVVTGDDYPYQDLIGRYGVHNADARGLPCFGVGAKLLQKAARAFEVAGDDDIAIRTGSAPLDPITLMGKTLTCVVMPVCSPASDLECACRFPKKEAKAEAPKPAKKPVKVVPRKRTRKAA
jgi:hypothetical protein